MYTATPLEIDHSVIIFDDTMAAYSAPESELWDLSHDARTNKPITEVSVTAINSSESEPEDPNEELASHLRGKTLTMTAHTLSIFRDRGWPALDMDQKNWSAEQEATYLRLKRDLEDIMDVALEDSPDVLAKAKACDYALFNMLWHPPTDDYNVLVTSSLLSTGMFVWDDFADSNDGSLGQDFDRACEFRQQTLKHMKMSLGLDDATNNYPLVESGPLMVFSEFARRIKTLMSTDQLRRVYEELAVFVNEAEAEHRDRLSGYVPASVPEYLRKRFNSSGCYPGFYVLEIFNRAPPLPPWIMESEEMHTIFDEANYIISVHNDIYSFKKEVAQRCLINIIPVLYRAGVSWERIMPTLDAELRASAERLDRAARVLVDKVLMTAGTGDGVDARLSAEAMAAGVERLVDGIRHNATGNLGYGLVAKRYKSVLESHKREDGSIEIVL